MAVYKKLTFLTYIYFNVAKYIKILQIHGKYVRVHT